MIIKKTNCDSLLSLLILLSQQYEEEEVKTYGTENTVLLDNDIIKHVFWNFSAKKNSVSVLIAPHIVKMNGNCK